MKKEIFYSNLIIRGGLSIALILTLAEGLAQVVGKSSNEEIPVQTRRNGDLYLYREENLGPYSGILDVNYSTRGNHWVEGNLTLIEDGTGRFMYDAINGDTNELALFLGDTTDPQQVPRLISQHELFDFSFDAIISPAISPDSQYVVYIHTFVSLDTNYIQNDIVLVPLQGGEPRVIVADTDAEEVFWTPDGTGIEYIGFQQTFRLDADLQTGNFSEPYPTS
jgi:hypothetical protein